MGAKADLDWALFASPATAGWDLSASSPPM